MRQPETFKEVGSRRSLVNKDHNNTAIIQVVKTNRIIIAVTPFAGLCTRFIMLMTFSVGS